MQLTLWPEPEVLFVRVIDLSPIEMYCHVCDKFLESSEINSLPWYESKVAWWSEFHVPVCDNCHKSLSQ